MHVRDLQWDAAAEQIDWSGAFQGQVRSARALLGGLRRQIESELGSTRTKVLAKVARGANWLMGGHLRGECDTIAGELSVDPGDVLLANLAYELTQAAGCTTFAVPTPNGPLHARTLDWAFPSGFEQRLTTVYRIWGAPAGAYALVGWPGLFGAFTAIAPGRFSLTVNYVHHDDYSPIDAATNALAGRMPVPWAMRAALDEARNFDQAVELLSTMALISPVMFTVVGTRNHQRVTIERCPDYFAHRRAIRASQLITANVYQHDAYLADNPTEGCDDCDGDGVDAAGDSCEVCEGSGAVYQNDSVARIEYIAAQLGDAEPTRAAAAIAVLADDDGLITYANTQHAVAMCARTGELLVQVPGEQVVTVPL